MRFYANRRSQRHETHVFTSSEWGFSSQEPKPHLPVSVMEAWSAACFFFKIAVFLTMLVLQHLWLDWSNRGKLPISFAIGYEARSSIFSKVFLQKDPSQMLSANRLCCKPWLPRQKPCFHTSTDDTAPFTVQILRCGCSHFLSCGRGYFKIWRLALINHHCISMIVSGNKMAALQMKISKMTPFELSPSQAL